MKALLLITAASLLATSRPAGQKALAVALCGLLIMGMIVPQPAFAQFGFFGAITGLFNSVNQVGNSVLSFLNNTMRPLLEGIQSAAQKLQGFLTQLRNLWEQVVWPISEINRAKALAQQLIGRVVYCQL